MFTDGSLPFVYGKGSEAYAAGMGGGVGAHYAVDQWKTNLSFGEVLSSVGQGAWAGLTGAPGKGMLQMTLGAATTAGGVVVENPYSISGGITLFNLGMANYLGGLVNGPDFKGIPLLPDMDLEIWQSTVETNERRQNQPSQPGSHTP